MLSVVQQMMSALTVKLSYVTHFRVKTHVETLLDLNDEGPIVEDLPADEDGQ